MTFKKLMDKKPAEPARHSNGTPHWPHLPVDPPIEFKKDTPSALKEREEAESLGISVDELRCAGL